MTEVHKQWSELVGRIEAESAAEIVVAVQTQADPYAEVAWKMALLMVLVTLVVLVHSPIAFHPDGVVLNAALMAALGYALGATSWNLRRWLSTPQRRRRALQNSLLRSFEELQISHTRQRSGLLLLVSYFEGRALLKPDLGLLGRVPGAQWNEWQHQLDQPGPLEAKVSRLLEQMQPLLAQQMPRQVDAQDELSNQVRILC